MTGRPLGTKQKNRQTWATTCVNCGCTLINVGSSRPRNNCGNHKKIRVFVGKEESKKRSLIYQKNKTARQHALVNAFKQSVGECYYHEQYFGYELLVNEQTFRAFCWDHVNRLDKIDTIAQMIGKYTDDEIIAEINKCVLSCNNCHQIKTFNKKDHLSLKQAKTSQPIINMQLQLFDN